MRSIEVKPEQTIIDIALQEYGSAEAVIKLVQDNPALNLESELTTGTILQIIQEPDKAEIVKYYSKFNHIVLNGKDS